MVSTLRAEKFCPDPARDVGERLARGFTGERSRSRTLEGRTYPDRVPVGVLDTTAGQATDNVRALAKMGVAVVLLGFSGVGHLI